MKKAKLVRFGISARSGKYQVLHSCFHEVGITVPFRYSDRPGNIAGTLYHTFPISVFV